MKVFAFLVISIGLVSGTLSFIKRECYGLASAGAFLILLFTYLMKGVFA